MKRFISLLLVVSILTLSIPLTAKEKRGADLIIQKTDGQQVRGELIAVKENSLLLLERDSGADVTVDIGEVSSIRILKKSKILSGAWKGLLIFGGAGALLGTYWSVTDEGFRDEYGALFAPIICIGFFGGIGLLLGAIVGAASGIDETIQMQYKSDSEIQESLEKLRKKARVRNSQ